MVGIVPRSVKKKQDIRHFELKRILEYELLEEKYE